MMFYPITTSKDILENPQLSARDFWVDVEHAELGRKLRYPGSLVKMTEYNYTIQRRAPLVGEHNTEIYQEELGLSTEETLALKQANVI